MEDKAGLRFQSSLKAALDAHHPHWEVGYKGKSVEKDPMLFTKVTKDTLKAWVYTDQRPKPGVFTRFLEEANFPQEIHDSLLQHYRKVKHLEKSETSGTVDELAEPPHQILKSSEADTAPTPTPLPKRINCLWVGLAIVGAVLLLAVVIIGVLVRSQVDPATEVGTITIVGSGNQLLTLQSSGQTVFAPIQTVLPLPVKIGETVTITFKIQNTDTHVVRIKALSGGAQGPS